MSKNTNLYLSDETKRKALAIAEAMNLLDRRNYPSMSQAVTVAIEALHEQINQNTGKDKAK